MTLDPKRIEAKVAARKAARELVSLLEVPNNYGADYADALCEELRSLLPKRKEEPAPAPVSFIQLAFTEIPFGQHRGERFHTIPIEYLDWLCREQETFLATLRAYLKHPECER